MSGSRRLGGCCLSSAKEGERRWSQNVNTPACNTPGEWGTGCWGEQAPTALAAATEAGAHAHHPAASPGFILKQNLIQVMVTWSLFLTLPLRSCKSIRKAACRSGRAPALANPGMQVLSGRPCRAQTVQEPCVVRTQQFKCRRQPCGAGSCPGSVHEGASLPCRPCHGRGSCSAARPIQGNWSHWPLPLPIPGPFNSGQM